MLISYKNLKHGANANKNRTYELQIDLGREQKTQFWRNKTLRSKKALLVTPYRKLDLTWLGIEKTNIITEANLTIRYINSKGDNKHAVTTKIHPIIAKRFVNLLARGEPKTEDYNEYCCFDFAHELIFGRKKIPAYTSFEHCFVQSRLSTRYNPHDVVVIAEADGQRLHYAMALSNNLFISKFGVHGPLAITTLDEMMKFYKGGKHFRLTPQRDMPSVYFNANNKINKQHKHKRPRIE